MNARIVTLWGEEIIPQQAPAPAKNGDTGEKEKKTRKAKTATANEEIPAEHVKKSKPEAVKKMELPDSWEEGKKYYSIGEVAALFKVKTSHIRFWTNEFGIKVRTTRKGDRLYTEDQIRELKAIHHLVKERGFTLTGAKAKLKGQNKREVEAVDLRESLVQLRGRLVAIRAKMDV